ncbi:hypothetical protein QCA50_010559 [Cerrena zonata]|uniref:Uncharacterized protein n=1 Tax=Cerrena zonata TaxID=2478898 RepID=A0AAW0GB94_9APHY
MFVRQDSLPSRIDSSLGSIAQSCLKPHPSGSPSHSTHLMLLPSNFNPSASSTIPSSLPPFLYPRRFPRFWCPVYQHSLDAERNADKERSEKNKRRDTEARRPKIKESPSPSPQAAGSYNLPSSSFLWLCKCPFAQYSLNRSSALLCRPDGSSCVLLGGRRSGSGRVAYGSCSAI